MPSQPKVVKSILSASSLAALITVACGQAPSSAAPATLTTSQDSTLYAIGMGMAGQLQGLLTEPELAIISQGLRDGVLGEERFELGDFITRLDPFLKERRAVLAQRLQAESVVFLAEAAKEAGAVVTESGLIYFEQQAGTGRSPELSGSVTAHYTGMFMDGKVFDSSVSRGEPTTFELTRVIKGWQEGLQMMKEGGKAKLVIPSELGYGERGGRGIPGNAALVFEIELIEVH